MLQLMKRLLTLNILCPYCLSDITAKAENGRDNGTTFSCPSCRSVLSPELISGRLVPILVFPVVGDRNTGKSTYLSALQYSFDELPRIWQKFYTYPIDENALQIIRSNVDSLRRGELPPPTPIVLPTPAVIDLMNLPLSNDGYLFDRRLIIYDSSGESMQTASTMIEKRGDGKIPALKFLCRARTICFINDIDSLQEDGSRQLHYRLVTFHQGLKRLNGDPKKQALLIVLTKGDKIKNQELRRYLENGSVDKLKDINRESYMVGMREVSMRLRAYLRDEIGAAQFLSFAADRFRSVEFCIVSALGAEPVSNRLQVKIQPKRCIDPIIWSINNSLFGWDKWGELQ